jgi:hypothetical protein
MSTTFGRVVHIFLPDLGLRVIGLGHV